MAFLLEVMSLLSRCRLPANLAKKHCVVTFFATFTDEKHFDVHEEKLRREAQAGRSLAEHFANAGTVLGECHLKPVTPF